MGPFFLGLFVFTFILLMNKILELMDMVINKGIGIGEVFLLVVYLMPSFCVLTIPMSILLAMLICLGRLSADSEIIAMRTAGVSLYQMLPPFAAFCAAGFFLTGLTTLVLLPAGNYAFRSKVVDIAKKHSGAGLEEGVFSEAFEDMVVYINRFDQLDMKIHGIMIADSREEDAETLIIAQHGELFSNRESEALVFRLYDGSLHMQGRKGEAYQFAVFDTYEMNLSLSEMEKKAREIKFREMDLDGLKQEADRLRADGKSAKKVNLEIHRRFAFPFACLVFGLIGLPLGVSWRKGGRSFGFVVSIGVVFIYYLLINIGDSLAKSGYLYAFMGMWMPNFLYALAGLYLFRKAIHEKPFLPRFFASQNAEEAFERLAAKVTSRRKW